MIPIGYPRGRGRGIARSMGIIPMVSGHGLGARVANGWLRSAGSVVRKVNLGYIHLR